MFYQVPPFKVATVGDWGCGTDTDRTVTNIEAKDPEIILALGDLRYQGSGFPGNACNDTAEWVRTMKPISKNLFLVIGNHDIAEKSIPNCCRYISNILGDVLT